MGQLAFSYCTSLSSVIIPNGVTTIENDVFYFCSSLTTVAIPNSVTSIESGAFVGCFSLTTIAIPESVKSIKEKAFGGCMSLMTITIPKSVTEIGWEAFRSTALYNDPANWENGALYINDCLIQLNEDFVGDYRIKENTRLIADHAFAGCSSLTSVTIPNSVTSIGRGAFPEHTQIIRQ